MFVGVWWQRERRRLFVGFDVRVKGTRYRWGWVFGCDREGKSSIVITGTGYYCEFFLVECMFIV